MHCENFVSSLHGALHTDRRAARQRERIRRAAMSTGAGVHFTTSSGIADGQPYCGAIAGCLGLLLWVFFQQPVVVPRCRREEISSPRGEAVRAGGGASDLTQTAERPRAATFVPSHRQKNDVRNGSLDGSPVRGPAGREPTLFTLPFESSRLNGRKSRSGKSVPGSGRLRGISRPNTRSFFRPCLQRANGRARLR